MHLKREIKRLFKPSRNFFIVKARYKIVNKYVTSLKFLMNIK